MILPGLVPAGVPVNFRVTWDRIVPGLEQIPSDVIPLTDVTYDLGSTLLRWASIFVGANGLDVMPGSDIDCDLVTVAVSGTPRFYWDDGPDQFVLTHKLRLTSTGGYLLSGGGDVDYDVMSVDITGAPKLWWDESEDAFAVTHRLILPSLNLGGSTVLDIITGTAAFDPGNLIAGASATTTITVTGAEVGDGLFVDNPFIQDDNELVLTAYVSASNTVTVSLVNAGLAAIDAASRTVRAVVFKF